MDLLCVINGICYVHKTGYQWRMMPRDIGSGHTIYGYVRRWRLAGVWSRGGHSSLRGLGRCCHVVLTTTQEPC